MLTGECIGALVDDFIRSLKVNRNLSKKSLNAYRYDLRGLERWVIENASGTVGKEELSQYFTFLANGSLKPSSIRRKLVTAGAFIEYCIDHGVIATKDKPSKVRGGFIIPKRLPKTVNDHNISLILSTACELVSGATTQLKKILAIRNYAIIELLYSTGIRIGELSAMNIDDFSMETQEILINGKGRKERLVFLANAEALLAVKTWFKAREELLPTTSALFINRYGGRLSIYGIEDVFSNILSAAGIREHATPHFLRHSFATKLLSNGANIRDVQELLGHSSIMTTQIYTEVSAERKRYVLTHYNGRNALQLHAKCS